MIQPAPSPVVAGDTCAPQSGTCAAAGTGPRFGLKFLFLAVTVVGIWGALFRVQNGWSMGVVSVILLTWLFGCPRTRRATVFVTAAMYLPFVWLLLIDYPWNEYRWQWIRMWGSLPGLLPMRVCSSSDSVYLPGSMILTAAGFLTAVTTIRFVRSAWYWMTVLVTIICCYLAWGCLIAFLA
jgi:hypothetical protein